MNSKKLLSEQYQQKFDEARILELQSVIEAESKILLKQREDLMKDSDSLNFEKRRIEDVRVNLTRQINFIEQDRGDSRSEFNVEEPRNEFDKSEAFSKVANEILQKAREGQMMEKNGVKIPSSTNISWIQRNTRNVNMLVEEFRAATVFTRGMYSKHIAADPKRMTEDALRIGSGLGKIFRVFKSQERRMKLDVFRIFEFHCKRFKAHRFALVSSHPRAILYRARLHSAIVKLQTILHLRSIFCLNKLSRNAISWRTYPSHSHEDLIVARYEEAMVVFAHAEKSKRIAKLLIALKTNHNKAKLFYFHKWIRTLIPPRYPKPVVSNNAKTANPNNDDPKKINPNPNLSPPAPSKGIPTPTPRKIGNIAPSKKSSAVSQSPPPPSKQPPVAPSNASKSPSPPFLKAPPPGSKS
eukprot:GDKJ01048107.1.p1 GENE.GDKJ01048107.1~~GDKJ01048107.1.p1  ORF type:complete len:411 (-),score=85.19 GDKJ01048107.1:55-1287(-)